MLMPGDPSCLHARCTGELAGVRLKMNRPSEAEAGYRIALEGLRRGMGSSHPDSVKMMHGLAKALVVKGPASRTEGVALLEEVVKEQEGGGGDEDALAEAAHLLQAARRDVAVDEQTRAYREDWTVIDDPELQDLDLMNWALGPEGLEGLVTRLTAGRTPGAHWGAPAEPLPQPPAR
jgi:hypothetical protein